MLGLAHDPDAQPLLRPAYLRLAGNGMQDLICAVPVVAWHMASRSGNSGLRIHGMAADKRMIQGRVRRPCPFGGQFWSCPTDRCRSGVTPSQPSID
jgi:hypothetical protein